ncbi:MAG: hypothetical protein DLM72_00770 [Candidatus Nitrosopolaris wilkensis]|nr:MAG: hypothetical protein DLM72_00770 [Candidatus Nitrosopolaris wilkensis]
MQFNAQHSNLQYMNLNQHLIKLDAIRRNTENITFRLDKDTLEEIRNMAKREKYKSKCTSQQNT